MRRPNDYQPSQIQSPGSRRGRIELPLAVDDHQRAFAAGGFSRGYQSQRARSAAAFS
jgi:hypothetical protein